MYLIKWNDNGIEKSDVAEAWIIRDSLMEELTEKGFDPVCEVL